ncbi:GAF domain-containing hybrid sensor histidine kinase/response regulator [Sphingobium yanoikuyae]|uniref:histidine kinase n=1 Tax=Sphingobium yanoikuyae TaxID=13690 RepID=A0A9X7U7T9_SPHYA|nr:PAS domain-containing protein [Sphingobium yanoikuyae]QNG45366.1 PAS domain-containing protein [Sphingobium yanoikuyae]
MSETVTSGNGTADAQRIEAEVLGLDAGTDPFVAAVRATRMPMIITNPRLHDNPVVFANDSFCRLTGYERDEILGRNCRFLQGSETDPTDVQAIHDAVEAVRPIEIDIRNYRKCGEPFWNRLLLAPVFDGAGKLAYFFASQVDVTLERERLEGLENSNAVLMAEITSRLQRQNEQERELDFALRAGKFGTWSINFETGELASSPACRALFGVDTENPFTYDDRLAAIHPADRAANIDAIDLTRRTGVDFDVTYRIVTPGGEIRWLTSRGQPFLNADGKPVRLAGISSDVTELRRAERMRNALVEFSNVVRDVQDPADISFAASRILGEALEVSRAGYGVIDPALETITIERDWNAEGISSLAGVLQFRDYGSYIEDLKRGKDVIIADADLDPRSVEGADALKAISAQAVVNMPLTEQGGLVALLYLNHATARDWLDDEIAFVREVAERTRVATERRRAEIELRELAASLEQQVEERTRDLIAAEEALRQSQKMEAVGQLTGGLAHDFNNLLTGITGGLEMIQIRRAQGRHEDVDRYVHAAQGAARRAAALTHRLLAFSRRQTLAPKPTCVVDLVNGMVDLVMRTVGPAIEVEAVNGVGLWPVLVDPSQLENALLNLCINARDAMPDGGKITIETGNRWLDRRTAVERDMEPGQYVSLCVSDTGTGMSKETISKAFDPFFTTKPIGMGTGLGLSMIYGFTRQSGGQTRIYSELGRGSTICLYLPRHLGEAGTPATPEAEPALAPQAREGETVLVIDDEPTVRMLVVEILEGLGYAALEAIDGAAGLKILESNTRVDLLITDVGLPGGMNGRQVADAARVNRPDLKILFITGYAENAVLSHGHLDPGMHVLTKPFSMEAMKQRITDLLH